MYIYKVTSVLYSIVYQEQLCLVRPGPMTNTHYIILAKLSPYNCTHTIARRLLSQQSSIQGYILGPTFQHDLYHS